MPTTPVPRAPASPAAQVQHLSSFIPLTIVSGLAPIALWLWDARANGQGGMGTQPVHGAVRRGDAGPDRRLQDAGIQVEFVPMAFGRSSPC